MKTRGPKTRRALSFDLSKNLYIEEHDLENLTFIGHGSFGHVWKAISRSHGKPVAVKKVNIPIEEEGMILNSVNHPNVIQYYGVIHSPPNYGLVMEYAENGSLADFIHKRQQVIDFGCKESFIQQILSGMTYLHHGANFPIVHRDLKPQNILLTNNYTVTKLADFGCAKLIGDDTISGSNKGSFPYMAPELIRQEGKLSRAADVYSFGVVLWEILTQKRPFAGQTEYQIIYFKGEGKTLPIDDETDVVDPYKEIIRKCFEHDRKLRPNFSTIHSVLNTSLSSTTTDTSIFSLSSEQLGNISASGDNSHLAWIVYPPEVVPTGEWNPGNGTQLAASKDENSLILLDLNFLSTIPTGDEKSDATDIGPELRHKDSVTCFAWGRNSLLVGTSDGRLWLWSTEGVLLRRIIIKHQRPIVKVEWNADCSLIGVLCRSDSSDTGTDLYVVTLETEFSALRILSFNSPTEVLAWSRVKNDLLACCESHRVHIFKNDDFSLSAPKTGHQSEIVSAIWSHKSNYLAFASKTILQIFSVEYTEDSKMKVRSKTAMSKLGEIESVQWHPAVAEELFVSNFCDIFLMNIVKKTHLKVFTAPQDHTLSTFSLNPNGEAMAIFELENWTLHLINLKNTSIKSSERTPIPVSKIQLMKNDQLIREPVWSTDGSKLCVGVEYAKNNMNLFDYSLLIVDLQKAFHLTCLLLGKPKNVSNLVKVSAVNRTSTM